MPGRAYRRWQPHVAQRWQLQTSPNTVNGMKHPFFLASLLALMAHLPAHAYLQGGCLWPFLNGQTTFAPQPDKQPHRPLDLKGNAAVATGQPAPSIQLPADAPNNAALKPQ